MCLFTGYIYYYKGKGYYPKGKGKGYYTKGKGKGKGDDRVYHTPTYHHSNENDPGANSTDPGANSTDIFT
jgi:hypothetical protein